MSKPDSIFILGHDTNAKKLSNDIIELVSLERAERYEVLADLHRDDSTSDAGYFLLENLMKEGRKLQGEAKLDVFYTIGRIQLECDSLQRFVFHRTSTRFLHSTAFKRNA